MFPVPLNQSPVSSLLTVSIEVDKLVNDNNSKQYPFTFIIVNETTPSDWRRIGESTGLTSCILRGSVISAPRQIGPDS